MRTSVLLIVFGLASRSLMAQEVDIPLTNWTVPPYSTRSSGGITTMTDATPPRAFVGIQPCRVADTRGNGAPIQGGIFPNGGLRTWDLTGICGIPAGAEAISANFTVTGSPSAPPGAFLLAWPTGGPTPPVSILNFQAGQTLANAAIVPLGAGEQINVNVSHSTHVILDVNGYFSDTFQNTANQFEVRSSGGVAIFGENTASGYGVWGVSAIGFGVVGGGGAGGVWATTAGSGSGVYGQNTGTTNGAAGVFGAATGAAGNVFGVKGTTASASNGSAGVKGVSRYGDPLGDTGNCDECLSAGVRGVDAGGIPGNPPSVQSYGVLGVSKGSGVAGFILDPSDITPPVFNTLAGGCLGCLETYPVPWGVYAFGDVGATGVKPFIEPHPYDPSKVIRYIALEGPEPGTYFRGRAKFERGMAVIEVPEDFRLVTDSEGLSVQVTPLGEMASVAVVSIGLDRIVVKGSRNVEFFYTVNGVRRTFKDLRPIGGTGFVPSGADARIPKYLSDGQRQLLIQNGTYNADGTVNMETARRLGWDKEWEKRERPAPQPAPQAGSE